MNQPQTVIDKLWDAHEILRREDGKLIGLVARRDLLRVRANMIHHEHEREALIQLRPPPRHG